MKDVMAIWILCALVALCSPLPAFSENQCYITWSSGDCPDQGLNSDDCNPYNDPYGDGYNYMQYYHLIEGSFQNRIVWVSIQSYEKMEDAQQSWDDLVAGAAGWSSSEIYEGPIDTGYYNYIVVGDKLNGASPEDKDDWLELKIYALYRGNRVTISTQRTESPWCGDLSTVCGETDYDTILEDYKTALRQTAEFIDSKCGGSEFNSPPEISILPVPESEKLEFERSIMDKDGFTILMEDADGPDDLDINTFTVMVAGVDKTVHFLSVLLDMWDLMVEVEPFDTGLSIIIKPDPKRFMTDQNLFNIQWNGTWSISFEICDKSGECHTAQHDIYFGPFFYAGDAEDRDCSEDSSDTNTVELNGYVIGNYGHITPVPYFYLVLIPTGESPLYYWIPDQLESHMAVVTEPKWLLPPMPLDYGFSLSGSILNLPNFYFGSFPLDRMSLPEGTHKLYSTVIDSETNAMRIYSTDLTICH